MDGTFLCGKVNIQLYQSGSSTIPTQERREPLVLSLMATDCVRLLPFRPGRDKVWPEQSNMPVLDR